MTIAFLICALTSAAEPLVTGPVEKVADGFAFTEGPAWLPGGVLVFSDIPANTIYRADKTIYRKPSGNSNGLFVDRQGRLLACEHGNRRVTREENDGSITVLAESYQGKKLNSPNDCVVRSDGTVYFTDPPYGISRDQQEQPHQGVYAIRPGGSIELLISDFNRPNGITLSPDEKTLYVADSEDGFIRAFDVAEDGSVSNGRLFCELPVPDGMAVDERGQIWCTAQDGVRVYSPKGQLLHTVAVPNQPANCTFGDEDRKTLYITARGGLFKVRCAVAGLK